MCLLEWKVMEFGVARWGADRFGKLGSRCRSQE